MEVSVRSRLSNSRPLRSVLLLAGILLVAFVLGFLFFARYWGYNQALTPMNVQHRLVQGMSMRDAEYNLGMYPGTLTSSATNLPDGRRMSVATRPGVGHWLVPQYQINLFFTEADKLTGIDVRVVNGLDESAYSLDLPEVGRKQYERAPK